MRLAASTLLLFLCVCHLGRYATPKPLKACILQSRRFSFPKCSLKEAHEMIRAAARKHRVPAAFVKSIIAAESNFNPEAVSPKGAIGLMQLMPETAEQFGVDPTIPEQNIDGGTRYLGALMKRYQRSRDWLRRTIAAYNAGPAVVDRYRGVPPFRETRTYVARVLALLKRYQREG